MVSRRMSIRIALILLAIVVLSIPFFYRGCQIREEQLQMTVESAKWVVGPDGGILTMKLIIDNKADCDADLRSIKFSLYRLINFDNTTQEVDIMEEQSVFQTVGAGGKLEMNYAFGQAFVGEAPRAVVARITLVLEGGSSLEVFDGEIQTTSMA